MIGQKRMGLELGGSVDAPTLAELLGDEKLRELSDFYRTENRYRRMLELMGKDQEPQDPEPLYQDIPQDLPVSRSTEALELPRAGRWLRMLRAQEKLLDSSGAALTEAEEAYLKRQLLGK